MTGVCDSTDCTHSCEGCNCGVITCSCGNVVVYGQLVCNECGEILLEKMWF